MKAAVASAWMIAALALSMPLAAAQDLPAQPGTVTRTETTTTTTVTRTAPIYSLPPYQVGVDAPIRISYQAPDASRVDVRVRNLTTGKTYVYALTRGADGIWVGEIPPGIFQRGDRLDITYQPLDAAGLLTTGAETSTVIVYETLNTPAYYRETADDHPSDLLIVPFQDSATTSPAFNVYWPGLYYDDSPYPLAARVTSSRAPENSVRKLDPIPGRPGWFQFQVPTLWFSPGEEIVVDFSTARVQPFSGQSDYPTPTAAQFTPVDTVRFRTRLP